jgi:hypothetical protein
MADILEEEEAQQIMIIIMVIGPGAGAAEQALM